MLVFSASLLYPSEVISSEAEIGLFHQDLGHSGPLQMSCMQKRLSHSEDEVLTCSEARGTSWCLLTLTMTGDEEGDFPARPFAAVP